MRLGAALFHKLIAKLGRERKIGKPVAVHMPEFDLTETKFEAAEAMRMGADPVPAQDRLLYRAAGSIHVLENTPKRRPISEPNETRRPPGGERRVLKIGLVPIQ